MQQHHAVIGQQIADLMEELAVMRHTHMLEHADGDDAVVLARLLPVVSEMEADAAGQPGLGRALGRQLLLLHRQRDARDVHIGELRQRESQPAQPLPISSTFWPGLSRSLAAICAFLLCCATSRLSLSVRK